VSAVLEERGLSVACAPEDAAVAEVARQVVAAWQAVARERRIVLAAPRSFCAGVERAIDIVESALRRQAGGSRGDRGRE
jgi:4-hydroxy-3-methylbut-2-enyl diphosphate reductase